MPDDAPHKGMVPPQVLAAFDNLFAYLAESAQDLPEDIQLARSLCASWVDAHSFRKARFTLGNIYITQGAILALEPQVIQIALARHSSGDWGDVDAHDWQDNELSLRHRMRLLSAYRSREGTPFWIITEADRSATTILLPEEY